MKAAVVKDAGLAPEYSDFHDPVLGDGQELVDLVAAGIHPVVKSMAGGGHYASSGSWPSIPGVDGVARKADGTLIYTGFLTPPYGTLAEHMAVSSQPQIQLPDGIDPISVAGGINPGLSSWLPLNAHLEERGSLGTVLILGVTGMAGLLAVQHAKLLGATAVIGVGRSPERLELAAAFGARTANLSGGAGELADALGGSTPDLVLDFLWGSAAESAFEVLGRKGHGEDTANISYVEIGAMAGATASLPAALLRSRRIRFSGNGAGSASMAAMMKLLPQYLEHIRSGELVVPTRVFPLSEVAKAWASGDDARAVVVP